MSFLKNVTPDNQDEYMVQMRRFNLGPVGEADCPVFDGMFEYCAVCLCSTPVIPGSRRNLSLHLRHLLRLLLSPEPAACQLSYTAEVCS